MFFSAKFEEQDYDEDEDELDNFSSEINQSQINVAKWITSQNQDFFKKLNETYEIQMLIQETCEEDQFDMTFSSDLILALGINEIPLIYQYDTIEKISHTPIKGEVSIALRVFKTGSKIIYEDFLGQLQLKDPLISAIYKSEKNGRPAIVEFQKLKSEILDQKIFDNFSRIATWLNEQKDQIFIDLKEKGMEMDVLIDGLLEGDCYRFAFPSSFLLECGKKFLAINLNINN